MASLEGEVGEPRAKDVHTVERGYLEQPTVLNNVETWANVPAIIANGSGWFAAKGTDKSKGTKIFALTGHVKNTGLVEVEMGTTLREIIFDIGGGAQDGKAIKAVQTGGPSGGCLPVSLFDLPVDYEALAAAGSMMGSGGMVVMDESACMVDVARYFLEFLSQESCGKCVPCRLGTSRMLEILTDIAEGRGHLEQVETLKELAWTMAAGSLCALGKTAPNPVLSTLQYFQGEYEAHIEDHRCPAGVCRALLRYWVDPELCTQCGSCVSVCPHGAIVDGKDLPRSTRRCANSAASARTTARLKRYVGPEGASMAKMVTITVDGTMIETTEGANVLEAALEMGICIPNLCHIPGRDPHRGVSGVHRGGGRRRSAEDDGRVHARGERRPGGGSPLRSGGEGTAKHRRASPGRGAELAGHPGPRRTGRGHPLSLPDADE